MTFNSSASLHWAPRPLSVSNNSFQNVLCSEKLKDMPPPKGPELPPRATSHDKTDIGLGESLSGSQSEVPPHPSPDTAWVPGALRARTGQDIGPEGVNGLSEGVSSA